MKKLKTQIKLYKHGFNWDFKNFKKSCRIHLLATRVQKESIWYRPD